jgi:hypothetical protein
MGSRGWVARGFAPIERLVASTLPGPSRGGKKAMRLTRFVRAVRLLLVLGVLGSIVGCGAQSQQVALEKVDDDGMLVSRKGIREFQKKQRESAKTPSGGRSSPKRQGP